MASEIEINVLGDFQLVRDGQPLKLPPSKKTRALLAYLAVVRRPQRRERLCEMFWDVPDDPRGALRWSLSKIRGVLNGSPGDVFMADRNTVAMAAGAVATDFGLVEALAGRAFETLGRGELETLAHAFRGRFLEDLSLPRCPEFEAWRVAHANEMDILRLKALRRLVELLADEPETALRYAQELHALAPDEPELPRLVARLATAAKARSLNGSRSEDQPASSDMRDAGESSVEVRYCTTRDGVRVAYAMTGSGPPLVRAAHWMSHLRYDTESPVWRHWIRELSARNTFIRYDERGNGMSEWDVKDIGFEAMVADLESIVDASGFEKVVLLGVSQGCAVTVAYSVRHPERVRGLILYGGYVKGWRARGDPEEIRLREAMGTLMRQGWGSDDPVFRQMFTSLFIPGASREQMDWFNELQRISVTPENAFRLAESFADIDVSALLPRVAVPTLVMHGRGDRVVPLASGKAFATGIRNARYLELDSSNHILLEDEPAFGQFIDNLRRFADEVNAPDKATRGGFSARRPVSVMIVELASALAETADYDPEAVADALDPLMNGAADLIRAQDGTIFETREGFIAAAFGADRALEEHAVRACRVALAIRERLVTVGQSDVSVRIAIDSGEAFIRENSGAGGTLRVSGTVAKDPSQLLASLERDVIALTARARESAGGFVSAAPMTSFGNSGTPGGGTVFELLAENRALSRWHLRMRQGLTPLVGRCEELAALNAAWQQAREGEGHAVAIVGEAGVGKSRLAHDFIGSLGFQTFTLVEAGAEEMNENVSHELVRRLLLSLLGLSGDEDGAAVARAVERGFSAFAVGERYRKAVLYALGAPIDDSWWREMQGADRAARVRKACRAMIRAASLKKPLLVLVEDLHWADGLSLAAVAELVSALAGHRILLIVTTRPGTESRLPDTVTTMRLSPLSDEQGRTLATFLLGDDSSLGDLHDLISERAAGVPLFIEEIVGQMVHSGSLAGLPGEMRLGQSTQNFDIPATIQSLVAVRIERVEPNARRLLQTAAVIGATAPRLLLEKASGLDKGFEKALDELRRAELLFNDRSDVAEEYAFKHALVRDATYASLSSADRKALHVRTLSALQQMSGIGRSDNPEWLAYHAVRAEDWEAATRHLLAAADRAIEHSAYRTAADFLEQAIETVSRLPRSSENIAMAIDIRTRLRVAYMVTGQFDNAVDRLCEAQALAKEIGDTTRLAGVLLYTSYVHSTYGRAAEALAVAEEARAAGHLIGDDRYVAEADLAAAQAHMIVGAARPSLDLLLPHREAFTTRWADVRLGFLITRSVWYLGSLAATYGLLGRAVEADREIAETMRVAEGTGRPIDRYAAGYFESLVRIVGGFDDDYLAKLERLAAESRDRAPFPFYPWLAATLGHAQIVSDRSNAARKTLERARQLAEEANMPHFVIYSSAMLAVANARAGYDGSMDHLLQALESARLSGDMWIEFEVLMALGSVCEKEDARNYFALASEVAERGGFATFVSRAKGALTG